MSQQGPPLPAMSMLRSFDSAPSPQSAKTGSRRAAYKPISTSSISSKSPHSDNVYQTSSYSSYGESAYHESPEPPKFPLQVLKKANRGLVRNSMLL